MCGHRALKAVWFQKWFVHRRLRPEEYGGRVHVHKSGLPLVFPEGSPTHPSYGAGHATVAGACVTLLKALFDETFLIAIPSLPTTRGRFCSPSTALR